MRRFLFTVLFSASATGLAQLVIKFPDGSQLVFRGPVIASLLVLVFVVGVSIIAKVIVEVSRRDALFHSSPPIERSRRTKAIIGAARFRHRGQ